jgi:Na+/melibiose symporter-like transporter
MLYSGITIVIQRSIAYNDYLRFNIPSDITILLLVVLSGLISAIFLNALVIKGNSPKRWNNLFIITIISYCIAGFTGYSHLVVVYLLIFSLFNLLILINPFINPMWSQIIMRDPDSGRKATGIAIVAFFFGQL